MPDSSAIITAVAALIGAFLGSIGRPVAEDRVARWREVRDAKTQRQVRARARVEKVVDLLGTLSQARHSPRWNDAMGNLRAAVASVNDQRLTEAVGQYQSGGGSDPLNDATWRAGELLRELDQGHDD